MWKWNRREPFLLNSYYHIYNRWYNKSIIFNNYRCFKRFYAYLISYLKEFCDVKIVSYSFLPNHFHLIVYNVDSTGTHISYFMKKLQWAYAIWHRIKYPLGTGTKLPFFEWRFKAKLIDSDRYLYKCLAYVNYNPLKHWIVNNIDNYMWTSYHQIDEHKINKYMSTILEDLEY